MYVVHLVSTTTASRRAVGVTWPFIPISYGNIKVARLKHYTVT
jgi:hypothetical protein